MKKLTVLLCFILLNNYCFSTHINGGSMTYKSLGNNNYEITLVVYRDCYNGIPPFDNPASIGVFDSGNNLLQNRLVPLTFFDTLSTPADCIPFVNICFEKGIYLDTINISTSNLPVTISYQRCCRSGTVLNLTDPLNHGMTFFTTINTALQNNSAVFGHEIPGFTYVGDNFIYNASATDVDGDSLVYSLTDCYDGGDQTNPQPSPPNNPPYVAVAWQAPHSLANIIGGSPPLTIDPSTGLMTAFPGTFGVFEIAENVDEYRNGVLINSSRREFLLFINPGSYYSFSGYVTVNSGSQILNIGKAWLIRKNMYDSTLYATDTNTVSSGAYSFPNTINGKYLVKASADSVSPFYANNIPTYYGDVLFWYQATELQLCVSTTPSIDINLVQGINPGGPGFVGGYISQGANRMMSAGDPENGITIILFNMSNQPVAYGITDNNGYFSIGNLALDTYKFYVDKLNALVDNNLAPSVTLSSANPVMNNLAFVLHSDYLELLGTVNIESNHSTLSSLTLIPNPSKSFFNVAFESFLQQNVELYLFDPIGSRIYFSNEKITAGKFSKEINVANLSNGIYFLELKTKAGVMNKKVVVQH